MGAQLRPVRPVLVETDFEATVLDPDGADVAEMARSDGFWPRPADNQEESRLGGRSWAMGRGAAPPKFRGDRRS